MSEPPADAVATPTKEPLADAGVVDLPAPPGWKKQLITKKYKKSERKELVFIAPTGEEFRGKKKLNAYLKANPGEISASSFDWNWNTGDTPRRSTRLSERARETETPPEEERPKKRARKSETKTKEVAKLEPEEQLDAKMADAEEEEGGKEEEKKEEVVAEAIAEVVEELKPVTVSVDVSLDDKAGEESFEEPEPAAGSVDASLEVKTADERVEGVEEPKPAAASVDASTDEKTGEESVEGIEELKPAAISVDASVEKAGERVEGTEEPKPATENGANDEVAAVSARASLDDKKEGFEEPKSAAENGVNDGVEGTEPPPKTAAAENQKIAVEDLAPVVSVVDNGN